MQDNEMELTMKNETTLSPPKIDDGDEFGDFELKSS
jgi:hypothetical protein